MRDFSIINNANKTLYKYLRYMKKSFLLLLLAFSSSIFWGQSITIETIDDLINLSTNNAAQGGYDGQTIELNNDLTITKPWRPIGTAAQPFQGTFKGNGHVISGLGAISGTDGIGLFGYVGANGTIQEVGIGTGHIKTMKNDPCRNIGSLAGHNAGTITRCWNMATIEANGTNVGGLVGQNAGTIEDCYNAGPILKATDIIGGLVGMNTGKINRCYNIGFARNGYGLVEKSTGTITNGYYDSQLYLQIPEPFEHFDPVGVTAVETTGTMFSLFTACPQWTNTNSSYPVLTVFLNHDAALVSVAAANLNPLDSALTDNHMNALMSTFIVNTDNGVKWSTTGTEQANWVFPIPEIPNLWGIAHPCRPTECILTVSKGTHIREVYAFPMPVYPFDPGAMSADTQRICVDDTLYFQHVEYDMYGDPGGGVLDYKVLLIATHFNFEGDSLSNDTLLNAGTWEDYYNLFWDGYWIPAEPGIYKIRRYTADSQCHLDYAEAFGFVPIVVPDTVAPGDINPALSDSICYADSVITITNKEPAQCSGATVLYYWTVNGDSITGAYNADLEYTLPQPGTYSFLRYAYNDKCTGRDDAKVTPTEYTVTLLTEFKAGEINSTDTFRICNPAEVISSVGTITTTPATGGDNKIGYQWYMIANETTTPLTNATAQDLTLNDVADQLHFEYNKTYSFFRMVNDSMCQAEPIASQDTVVIIVYPEFKEGDITNIPTYSICYEGNRQITITSATYADFGSLPYYYYWTVNDTKISGATDASLNYTLPNIPGQYIFKRYAYNDYCQTEENAVEANTADTVFLLSPFDPGTINNGQTTIIRTCTVEEALSQLATLMGKPNVIIGSDATGGDGTYIYQWDLKKGGVTNEVYKGKDLDMTQIALHPDTQYIFTRSVYDEKCVGQLERRNSTGQIVIDIFNTVTPGKIDATPIEKTCLIRSKTQSITININSLLPATAGERSTVTYTWYMEANGTANAIYTGKEAGLTYTLQTANLPDELTYTFYRTAVNDSCQCDEVKADGAVQVHISFTKEETINIALCESQFNNGLYVFSYPNKEEARISHKFYQNDLQPWTFNDPIEEGCQPSITVIPSVIPSPEITTDSVAEVCQDGETGTLTLYFQMVKGSANMYGIELSEGLRPYFNNQTYISGDLDETVHEGEPGVITLHSNRIGYFGGEKVMFLQVGMKSNTEGQSECFSTMKRIALTITQGGYIMSKYDKVLFIDNNPKKETDPKFVAYQWYKNGLLVEGATGQYYDEDGAILRGSYYADLTYLDNGKETILRTCTLQMPVENGDNALTPKTNVSKELRNGRITIRREEGLYDIMGVKMSNF